MMKNVAVTKNVTKGGFIFDYDLHARHVCWFYFNISER